MAMKIQSVRKRSSVESRRTTDAVGVVPNADDAGIAAALRGGVETGGGERIACNSCVEISGADSARVISIIVRRNPARANRRCADSFRSAVESTTRGAPRGPERGHCRIEQQPTDAVPAMGGIDDDVVHPASRPTQRHVVAPLDARVGVAEHFAAALRDEDDDARLIALCSEERGVRVLGLRRGRDEALSVEVVVHPDQQRAKSADGREVRGRCGRMVVFAAETLMSRFSG
jgi:hypothetical protein